jgi:hypothetical protein
LAIRHLAGDFGPRQALSNDLSDGQIKAVTVVHVLAVVVAKRLPIKVREEAERLYGNVVPERDRFSKLQ